MIFYYVSLYTYVLEFILFYRFCVVTPTTGVIMLLNCSLLRKAKKTKNNDKAVHVNSSCLLKVYSCTISIKYFQRYQVVSQSATETQSTDPQQYVTLSGLCCLNKC